MTWRLSRRQSYLKSSVEEVKKAGNDSSFMDIIKQFSIIYNRASADLKDWTIKDNACCLLLASCLIWSVSKDTKTLGQLFLMYLRKALGKSGASRDEIRLDPTYEHIFGALHFPRQNSIFS